MKSKKRTTRSAIQKIEDHEKLCRIMQKQTFNEINELKQRMCRLEKVIVGGLFAIFLALLSNHFS